MEMKSLDTAAELPKVNFAGGPLSVSTGSDKVVLPHIFSNVLEVISLNFITLLPYCVYYNICLPQEYEIVTASGIPLHVYHQSSSSKSVILTYHDIGTNRKFIDHSLNICVHSAVYFICTSNVLYYNYNDPDIFLFVADFFLCSFPRHVIFGIFFLPRNESDFSSFQHLPCLCSRAPRGCRDAHFVVSYSIKSF